MPELAYFIATLEPVFQVLAFLALCLLWGMLIVGLVGLAAATAQVIHYYQRKRNKR